MENPSFSSYIHLFSHYISQKILMSTFQNVDIFKKIEIKTHRMKKITWGCQKRKNPSSYELHSSKSNDQIFKNLTFLKTRYKNTSIKKNHPPPPYGGSWGGSKKSPTINKLGLLRRPCRQSDNDGNRQFQCNLIYISQKGQVCPNRISSF